MIVVATLHRPRFLRDSSLPMIMPADIAQLIVLSQRTRSTSGVCARRQSNELLKLYSRTYLKSMRSIWSKASNYMHFCVNFLTSHLIHGGVARFQRFS
jgi:hypothetical protein